jgi:hypothetical protein
MDYGPKVEAPRAFLGAQWAENNTDMPILGICIKIADFPSINYLWKRTLVVRN